MERLPGAVFVIDPKREELLVKEANRLKIPVVALTDTNCDPEVVDYVIPGNDDAIRSISLISSLIADAIVQARGEEAVPASDRPLPPIVEEAQVSEEIAAEQTSETANGRLEPRTDAGPRSPQPEAERVEVEAAEVAEAAEPEAEADRRLLRPRSRRPPRKPRLMPEVMTGRGREHRRGRGRPEGAP